MFTSVRIDSDKFIHKLLNHLGVKRPCIIAKKYLNIFCFKSLRQSKAKPTPRGMQFLFETKYAKFCTKNVTERHSRHSNKVMHPQIMHSARQPRLSPTRHGNRLVCKTRSNRVVIALVNLQRLEPYNRLQAVTKEKRANHDVIFFLIYNLLSFAPIQTQFMTHCAQTVTKENRSNFDVYSFIFLMCILRANFDLIYF